MIQDGRGFWEFLLHNWGCEFLGHLCMFPVIDWQTATALPPGTQHSKSSWNISVPSLRQIFVKQRVRRWTCHGMPFQRPWCQQEQLIVARPWEACGFALLFRFCDTHIYIYNTHTHISVLCTFLLERRTSWTILILLQQVTKLSLTSALNIFELP
jgi:hypothetical protein